MFKLGNTKIVIFELRSCLISTLLLSIFLSVSCEQAENETEIDALYSFQQVARLFSITQSGSEDYPSPVLLSVHEVRDHSGEVVSSSRSPVEILPPKNYQIKVATGYHIGENCAVLHPFIDDPRGSEIFDVKLAAGDSIVIEVKDKKLTLTTHTSELPVRFETFYYMLSSLHSISNIYGNCSANSAESVVIDTTDAEQNVLTFMAAFGFPEEQPLPFIPLKNEFDMLSDQSTKKDLCSKYILLAVERFTLLFGSDSKKWERYNEVAQTPI